MKLKIKTLTQKEFELEVDADEKVSSVKEKIRDHEGFEVSSQRLIYAGKILIDSSKLSDHQIKDGDALVVMATKPAAAKKEAPKVDTPAPAHATPAAAPASGQPAAPAPAPAPAVADVSETLVKQLTDMGFPRAEAIIALRAAFMNPDRAVEYLMNGIPDDLREMATAAAAAPAQAAAAGADTAAAAPAQPTENPLLFLLQQPQFLQMRALVQSNPQTLQPLLEELGRSNPDLLRLINENQEAFLDVINDTSMPGMPGAGGAGAGAGGGATIQVTQAEKEAIERLCALGFDRQMVLEAYLACDKNEEMAANYLMDNGNWN